ncbi:hypothetical protein ABZ484_17620 [Streptomyces sp. NPDC006393]|uniref:hypothetical protein n=1 Tax=Streptomyces sp. NPDC006393 TaxID=3156763 RepID=UPI0033D2BC91
MPVPKAGDPAGGAAGGGEPRAGAGAGASERVEVRPWRESERWRDEVPALWKVTVRA